MVDKSLYLASGAADKAFSAQQIHANNLANSKTVGFKADKQASFSVPIYGDTHPSRVGSVATENMLDLSQGSIQKTNNSLDMALLNEGYFVLQNMQTGEQVLSRDGQFSLNAAGQLINSEGLGVMGAAGPIVLPTGDLNVSKNGLIQIQEPDGGVFETQLLLARPEMISKRQDGYFESAGGAEVVLDPDIILEQGALEDSNVNPMYEMVSLIDTARHYEIQLKYMQNVQQNDEKLSQVMQL